MNFLRSLSTVLNGLKKFKKPKANDLRNDKRFVERSLQELHKKGIKRGHYLELKFFFIGNSNKNSQLFSEILQKEYKYKKIHTAEEKGSFIISGVTGPKPINEKHLLFWVSKMKRLGSNYDHQFVGWGANI